MTQLSNLTELVKRSFVEMMKDIGTSIPGHIVAFDASTQLAQIQIGIQRKDVKGVSFEPAPLIEVPVYFAGGSYVLEHQIEPNDEGVIIFSQRCIDAWVNTGGVAENPIMRFHDFSDAMFLPGLRSQPNKIESFSNDGIRLRNADASHYIWLKNDGTMELKNDNSTMTISASGAFNGEFTDFNVNSTTFTHNSVNVGDNHTHVPGTYNVSGTPVTGASGDPS